MFQIDQRSQSSVTVNIIDIKKQILVVSEHTGMQRVHLKHFEYKLPRWKTHKCIYHPPEVLSIFVAHNTSLISKPNSDQV